MENINVQTLCVINDLATTKKSAVPSDRAEEEEAMSQVNDIIGLLAIRGTAGPTERDLL